jgi:glycosyltransferase involved in cell wall biosynthesis
MNILMHMADTEYTPQRKKLNTYGPLGYYRILKPSQQIKGHEVKVIGAELKSYGSDLMSQWQNVFFEHDVFWTNYFNDEKVATAVFFFAQRAGKKVIIDVDDNYLDIPEGNNLYEKFKSGKRERALLGSVLSLADALTVSTFPLKERLQEHIKMVHGIDKPIFVIPNMNDVRDWVAPVTKPTGDRITIGYSASNSHQEDLQMVLPALKNIMKKYPNVHLQFIGTIEKEKLPLYFKDFDDDMLTRIELGAAESVFKDFPKLLGRTGWDIGIAPLVDTPFTRSKSHIKWMEYAMFEIPCVASRVYPYSMSIRGKKTIEDGVTGLLTRSNEWEKNLERMILDTELRKRIGKKAREVVEQEWQYEDGDIGDTINKMLETISGEVKL